MVLNDGDESRDEFTEWSRGGDEARAESSAYGRALASIRDVTGGYLLLGICYAGTGRD